MSKKLKYEHDLDILRTLIKYKQNAFLNYFRFLSLLTYNLFYIYLSMYQSITLFFHLSINSSIYYLLLIHLSIYLSNYLFKRQYIYLIFLTLCHACFKSIHLAYQSVPLSFFIIYPSIYLFIYFPDLKVMH